MPWLHAEAKDLRERALDRERRRDAGEDAGDPALSLAELNRATALDPRAAASDALTAFYRGALLARFERTDEAVDALRQALRVDLDNGGLGPALRRRAFRGLGRLVGRKGIDLGDPERVQEALRCLNRALDLGATDGVASLLDALKDALAALPAEAVVVPGPSAGPSTSTDAVGLIAVRLNDRADGFGDRDRVRARLEALYPAVFEPLRAGRAAEAEAAARGYLAPRFRRVPDPAAALGEIDEADLAALTFLGSALARQGRDGEAAVALKLVMAQAPFQSRVLPELRFLFRLAYEELRHLAAARGWLWINRQPVRARLAHLLEVEPLGIPGPRPRSPALGRAAPVALGTIVLLVLAATRGCAG